MSEAKIEAVYEFIKAYTAETGQSPSQKQIVKGCGMSQETVLDALSFLEARGENHPLQTHMAKYRDTNP